VARTYLDHASSSPPRPEVFDAMVPFLRDHAGDPGRLHEEGRRTRVAIEEAREQVAQLFGARPREVVFTASGTEAVNTAVFGACARAAAGRIVTTAVEHSSVVEACSRSHGFEVTTIGVDRLGRVDVDRALDAISGDTALVNVQLANHEVGTVQPAAAVMERAHDVGAVVHVDACAAAGHVPIDFAALDADLCSVTAHKLGGPKGAGALLVRRGLRFPPFLIGGAQERARRAGIEDVAAIVGFGAAAAALVDGTLEHERAAQHGMVEALVSAVVAQVQGVERLGDPVDRLPHVACLSVDGVEAEPILLALDQHGIAVHSGSSCSSEALEPSPVLAAMGVDAEHSLRVSVGWSSTSEDVAAFLGAFPAVVKGLRDLRR
jgi:cysteine desulfurase